MFLINEHNSNSCFDLIYKNGTMWQNGSIFSEPQVLFASDGHDCYVL